MKLRVKHIALYFMLLIVASGCATQATTPSERYFWPPPPDEPKIEWLKVYRSQLDIDRSTAQRFWAVIVGEDQAISLLKPIEVKSVPELNRFYVSDLGRSAVMVFDLDKHELRKLETPEGIRPISHPLSIVVDKDNNLFVLDRSSASVFVFDRSEKYRRSINLKVVSVVNPVAMAIDRKKGLLYVSDAASRTIVVVGLDGRFIKKIGSSGDADGQFNLPISLAVNSKGHLIVADAFGANIQIFDAEGLFVRKFGRRGDVAGDFQLIKSVAVDSNDNIYVIDGRSHTVTIFNEEGVLLLSLGGYYAVAESGKVVPGGFAIPTAIDIDTTDKIYIVDQMNARVQVFQYISEAYLRNLHTK